MSEPQAFDPSKPFSIVEAPPPPPPGNPGSLRAATNDYALPVVHAFGPKTEKAINDPLAHPTGIAAVDSLTSPLNIALTATLGAKSAAKALSAGLEAITAGVDKTIVAKTLKFLTPSKFREGLDLLTTLAEKASQKSEPVAAPAPAAPAEPVASAPVVQEPPAAPAVQSASPAPTEASIPTSPPQAALPDQKALNAEAIARRRAEYQARVAEASSSQMSQMTAEGKAAANVKLSAAETKTFLDLLKRMPGPEAMKNILMQRDLASRLGTPNAAQVAADVAHRNTTGKW